MELQTISGATEAQRAQKSHKPHAARASFAGALAKASTKSAADTPDSVLDARKAPKGEKSKAVEGHAYADITAGPRNGMYINTSGNKRDGQAFVLVKRDGKEFHIYGSGKDRVVVCLKRKDDDPKPTGTTGAAAS
jgi:uncharacterized membrane protein